MVSLSDLYAVNFTLCFAGILIALPVAGLTPERSFEYLFVNDPNPFILTAFLSATF